MQCRAMWWSTVQYGNWCMILYNAVRCSAVPSCVALFSRFSQLMCSAMQCSAVHNIMQCIPIACSQLQCNAFWEWGVKHREMRRHWLWCCSSVWCKLHCTEKRHFTAVLNPTVQWIVLYTVKNIALLQCDTLLIHEMGQYGAMKGVFFKAIWNTIHLMLRKKQGITFIHKIMTVLFDWLTKWYKVTELHR